VKTTTITDDFVKFFESTLPPTAFGRLNAGIEAPIGRTVEFESMRTIGKLRMKN
jgi:hypothetical protein